MLHLGPLPPGQGNGKGDGQAQGQGQAPGSRATASDAAPDWPARMAARAAQARDPRLQAYYRAGVVAAETPLCDVPLLAMDVETTGLDPARDGLVSIGLVPMDLQRIHASQARHWILRPRAALADRSVTLHGITHTRVRQAPDLLDVLDDVLATMAGHVMVVHCREIERQFLGGAIHRRLGEDIAFPVIDTMELEARLHRRPRPWLARLLRREAPRVSIRLGDSRQRYGLPRYRPHHAVTDALATAELLQAQVAHRYSGQTQVGELWR